MGFLKRHVLWLLLALVLVGEAGLAFVLVGKQATARQKRTEFEQKQKTLRDYEANPPGQPAVLEALGERKAAVKDELTDCLLFLWHRGQAIEQLFPDKRLADVGARPWTPSDQLPKQMQIGRFRLLYQTIYDEQVEKIAPRLDQLQVTRQDLGLAPSNFFTLVDITVGDIFAAQKKYWILKELVEIAAQTEMTQLAQVQVLREEAEGVGLRRPAVAEGRKGKLVSPLTVRLILRCNYPKLGGFLEGLGRSPLGFRVQSVSSVQRTLGVKAPPREFETVAPTLAPTPGLPPVPGVAPGTPPGVTPEMAAEGMAGVPVVPRVVGPPRLVPRPIEALPGVPVPRATSAGAATEQLAEVHLIAEAPDFNVEIQQVTFNKADFPTKKDVKTWVEGQLAAAKAELARAKAAGEPAWARETRDKLAAKASPAKKDEKAEPAEKKPALTLTAYPGRAHEREYLLEDRELADRWLGDARRYESLRVAALQALWEEVLGALETDRTRATGDVVITFRDEKHFDTSQWYDQELTIQLAPEGAKRPAKKKAVGLRFGLVTFTPEESDRGRSLWSGTLR